MKQKTGKKSSRYGLTLIELLVVGTIIIVVTAASLPVLKPVLESQMTRNGAQMAAAALNRARNRALATGRSCGVRFEIWPGTTPEPVPYEMPSSGGALTRIYSSPGVSLTIRQVEAPPFYSGLLGIESVTVDGGKCHFNDDIYAQTVIENSTDAKIQINGSGPFYSFRGNSAELKSEETVSLPPNREHISYPFKIALKPKTTMAMPTLLPQGTAVDLEFSGVGDKVFLNAEEVETGGGVTDQMTLTLIFAPDGSVESVNGVMPSEPVHFLIGRWDQISAVRTAGDTESYPNYADGRNYWVSVSPLTGSVTINPVNPTQEVEYRFEEYQNEYGDILLSPRLPDNVISISRELTK